MASQNAQPGGDWNWLTRNRRPLAGCLIFARGVAAERVIAAFGMDPGSAQVVPEDRVSEALPFRAHDSGGNTVCPYLRVGQAGGWAFAIDEAMLSLHMTIQGDNPGKRLSAGTEAVLVSWAVKPTEDFEY